MPFFHFGPEAALGALAAYLGGFVVAMPDLPHLGLDPSPGPHPFCHAQSLADCILDMVESTLESLDPARHRWDGRLFIAGYSAGGYAALAAVREAQRNPAYAHIKVTAAACMGGPFHFHEAIRGWITETGDPVLPALRPDLPGARLPRPAPGNRPVPSLPGAAPCPAGGPAQRPPG